eukprot:12759946-Ditylum_brightwellii.AAC.1
MEEQKEDGSSLFVIGESTAKEDQPTILFYNESESQEPVPLLVSKPKCIMLDWKHRNKEKLKLLSVKAFDLANNIPPYRLISTHDFKHMKHGLFKLSMMRYRAAAFLNLPPNGGKRMDIKQGS